ncbi:MAG: hypothetical protein Q8M03_06250 [Legionella sp.]|nr:hypothetical protein [Legionella sp.]
MPAIDQVYTKEQISQWNNQFLVNLQTILSKENSIHDAIAGREAIKLQGTNLKKDEVSVFLSDLQSGDISSYLIDLNRIHATLKNIGFNKLQIDRMSSTKKIVLSSAVFTAIANLNIAEHNLKLAENGGDPNLIFSKDVQQDLMDNMHLVAMPIAGRFVQDNGLTLLKDTLSHNTNNAIALGRLLLAMDTGNLTVNGQNPDKNYPLGEYVIHGGRIRFDLSKLSDEKQQEFFAFVTNNSAEKRAFATHRVGGTDASGSLAEAQSGFLGAIEDALRYVARRSKHYGINIAIGGSTTPDLLVCELPQENGEWGHIYLHQDKNIVMFGIEGSAPLKTNKRTGQGHSKTGKVSEFSPFLERRIESQALHDTQESPISTREGYNWAVVKVTEKEFKAMKERAIEAEGSPAPYTDLVNKTPDKAEAPAPNRQEKMQAWAKATKEANKTSILPRILGGLLIAVGIAIALTPLPGVSQAVGSAIVALGATIALGGMWLFANSFMKNPKKAEKFYKKMSAKISEETINPSSVDNNVSMTFGLGVKPKPEAAVKPEVIVNLGAVEDAPAQQRGNSVKVRLNSLQEPKETLDVEPNHEPQLEEHKCLGF